MLRNWFLPLLATVAALAQPPGGGPPPGGGQQQGDGIWLRNAFFGEAQTFDACGGHQPGNGQYHHHASPTCLREQLGDNVERVADRRTGPVFREKDAPWTHSPILGWAFDGYPIYGPYGYSDPKDAASEVKRLRSGYRLRNITERKSLPDWALPLHTNASQQLTAAQYGPPINNVYPLGRYLEDYEHAAGNGDLDVYNGRFEVTPDFPQGTYAYHVTIEADGTPAFPYILAGQFRGTVTGGNAAAVPDGLSEGAGSVPLLTSWTTANATQPAQVVTAADPSAGPKTTWGTVTTPLLADIQRVRYSDTAVYVNSNGVASYTMGPWFDVVQNGGIFGGLPTAQTTPVRLPMFAVEAATPRATSLGAQGIWVNGVAVFNTLDGSSYSNPRGADVGGGLVALAAKHVSTASLEQGPLAKGSLVTATPLFGLQFGDTPTVTIKDASGALLPATVLSASTTQIDYRLPMETAIGYGTVSILSGGVTLVGNVNIVESYLSLFAPESSTAVDSIDLTGSGLGNATDLTATVGGVTATVGVTKEQDGRERFRIAVPSELAGSGWNQVVLRAGGRSSNTVWVELQ